MAYLLILDGKTYSVEYDPRDHYSYDNRVYKGSYDKGKTVLYSVKFYCGWTVMKVCPSSGEMTTLKLTEEELLLELNQCIEVHIDNPEISKELWNLYLVSSKVDKNWIPYCELGSHHEVTVMTSLNDHTAYEGSVASRNRDYLELNNGGVLIKIPVSSIEYIVITKVKDESKL